MSRYVALFVILLLVLPISSGFSRENYNIIVVVDYSASMIPYFNNVKIFLSDLLTELLITDDYCFLIKFGTFGNSLFAGEITSDKTINEISDIIMKSKPDQSYSDIGLALETMFDTVANVEGTLHEKTVLLFITDGEDFPPPWSKYYNEEFKYQQAFYNQVELLRKSPWKAMLLSIGNNTAAMDLSKLLDGEYIEVSKDTISELKEKISDIFGNCELMINKKLGRISKKGKPIHYKIISTYSDVKSVSLTKIIITNLFLKEKTEWKTCDYYTESDNGFPVNITINPNEIKRGSFMFTPPFDLQNGTYKADIELVTEKSGQLLYSEYEVFFKIGPSWVLTICLIILIAIALSVGGWFLWRKFRWQGH